MIYRIFFGFKSKYPAKFFFWNELFVSLFLDEPIFPLHQVTLCTTITLFLRYIGENILHKAFILFMKISRSEWTYSIGIFVWLVQQRGSNDYSMRQEGYEARWYRYYRTARNVAAYKADDIAYTHHESHCTRNDVAKLATSYRRRYSVSSGM